MIHRTQRVAVKHQIAASGKRCRSVRVVDNIIMSVNFATKAVIADTTLPDIGVITGKGSRRSSHWGARTRDRRREILLLNIRRRVR